MTTGSIGRTAEHLVCAELSRRGLIATTFTHNVPLYDVVVVDDEGRSESIQVKGASSESWTFVAGDLMSLEFDSATETQRIVGNRPCKVPELIWVCVVVRLDMKHGEEDRFFILSGADVHRICCDNYREYLAKCGGHRKRNWRSVQYFWNTDDLKEYENNWSLITDRLSQKASPLVDS